MLHMQVKGIQMTSWADVTRAPPIDSSLMPFRPYTQCCGLKPGHDMVDFAHDCRWENVMSPNFTGMPQIVKPKLSNLTGSRQAGPALKKLPKLRGLIIRNAEDV